MVTVEVKLPKATASRLSTIAKEQGFGTREEYLRKILTEVAQNEFQLESDKRYEELIHTILNQLEEHEKIIEKNAKILEKFYQSELLNSE